jgi:hypothetical protein
MKPIHGTMWVVFDLDNGNEHSRRYCWCFESRQQARDHIYWQRRQPHAARLSGPRRYKEDPPCA